MNQFKVSQSPKFSEARTYAAESAEHAAAKLAILIPLGDWALADGTLYRLTIYAQDGAGERTEHTFIATVEVAQ